MMYVPSKLRRTCRDVPLTGAMCMHMCTAPRRSCTRLHAWSCRMQRIRRARCKRSFRLEPAFEFPVRGFRAGT